MSLNNHPHIKKFQLEQIKRGEEAVRIMAKQAKLMFTFLEHPQYRLRYMSVLYDTPTFKRLQLIQER